MKKSVRKMNRQKVIEHLMPRPIASVRTPTESDSDVALKLMFVLDYYLDHRSLYPRIITEPKLLEQLLRFNNFQSFKYYRYCNTHKFRSKEMLLKCEQCELIGRSEDVLEHMVMSHGLHKSTELCYWCGDATMQSHIDSNTLEGCHRNYLENNGIRPDYQCLSVIEDFYKLIRKIAYELGVLIRRKYYNATFSKATETIAIDNSDDDDICETVHVTKPRIRIGKTIRLDKLDEMFREAKIYFEELNYLEQRNIVSEVTKAPPVMNSQKEPQNQQMMDLAVQIPQVLECLPESEMSPNMPTGGPVAQSSPMFLAPQIPQIQPEEQMPPNMPTGGPVAQSSAMFLASPMVLMPSAPPEMVQTMKIASCISKEIINMYSEDNRREALQQIHQILMKMKAKDLAEHLELMSNDLLRY